MSLKTKRNLPIIFFLLVFLSCTALAMGNLPLVAYTIP
jgi:hypothetical protein